jgi:hypothetical protein
MRAFQASELVRRGRHPSLCTRPQPTTASVGIRKGDFSPTEFAGYFPFQDTEQVLSRLSILADQFLKSLNYPHHTSATKWQILRFLENESTRAVRYPITILLEVDEIIGAQLARLRAAGVYTAFRDQTYHLLASVKPPMIDYHQNLLTVPLPYTTGYDYSLQPPNLTDHDKDALHFLDMIGKVAHPFTRGLIRKYLSER